MKLKALFVVTASLLGGTMLKAQPFHIPLTQTDGLTYSLPVGLEDIGQIDMLLDTGAAYSTLEVDIMEELVRKGKAVKIGQKQARLANGELCPLYMYQLNELDLGGCILKNITVAATDFSSRNLIGIETLKQAEPIRIQLSPPALTFERCGSGENTVVSADEVQ